jgi:hypothetical protein
VSHGALAVVLVQLAHDHAQAVDETAGRNLKENDRNLNPICAIADRSLSTTF